ncbi:MAG: gliding motility protein [Chlorobi bacterium]|nr:gliding motility protein [Chlorobiota bacterium]
MFFHSPMTGSILVLMIALGPISAAHSRTRLDDVRDIVKKTKALYNSTTAAEVRFEQAGANGSTSGTLTYSGSEKFRLELPKQTIVSDGVKTWTYSPDKKQVVISKAAGTSGRLTPGEILTAFPGSYATELVGEQTVNGRAVWVVRCTPGNGKKIGDVTRATLYIDKGTYRFQQVDIESPTVGTVKLRITSAQYGVKVPETKFTFAPPQGVRVVDLSR